jgi:hypothetical protein
MPGPAAVTGYTAQPAAGSKVKAPAPAGSTSTNLSAATESALPAEGRVIVKVPPGFASTRQSAAGRASPAGDTTFSGPPAMKSRSRP